MINYWSVLSTFTYWQRGSTHIPIVQTVTEFVMPSNWLNEVTSNQRSSILRRYGTVTFVYYIGSRKDLLPKMGLNIISQFIMPPLIGSSHVTWNIQSECFISAWRRYAILKCIYYLHWLKSQSRPVFLYFCFFNSVDCNIIGNIKFADDWIWIADLWYQKQTLYQLCHNHCPQEIKVFLRLIVTAPEKSC